MVKLLFHAFKLWDKMGVYIYIQSCGSFTWWLSWLIYCTAFTWPPQHNCKNNHGISLGLGKTVIGIITMVLNYGTLNCIMMGLHHTWLRNLVISRDVGCDFALAPSTGSTASLIYNTIQCYLTSFLFWCIVVKVSVAVSLKMYYLLAFQWY